MREIKMGKRAIGGRMERQNLSRRMHRAIKSGTKPAGPIKVQLDARTVITLNSLKSLDFWRTRYPNLQVIKG